MEATEVTIKVLVKGHNISPGYIKFNSSKGHLTHACVDYRKLEVANLEGMEVDYEDWFDPNCIHCPGCGKNRYCPYLPKLVHKKPTPTEIEDDEVMSCKPCTGSH